MDVKEWRSRKRRDGLFGTSPIKRRIYEYLKQRKEGADTQEIMCFAYMHDPNGGPEWRNIISVHVAQMNKTLAGIGKKIVSTMGPEAKYFLVKLEADRI